MTAGFPRFARRAIAALAVGYAAYGVATIWLHPGLIYPFLPSPAEIAGFQHEEVPVPDAAVLPVLVHDAGEDAPVVLYFMGNAGSLVYFEPELTLHRDAGRSVVAMTYRGGGGVPGIPSERRLKDDALAVADWAASRFVSDVMVVHGYSLGSGLALHVAARRPVDQVILTAPFARLCTLMARASALPACWLPFVQKWDSLADVPAVSAHTLILHGAKDEVIPFAEGRRLGLAFPEGGVSLVPFQGAGHNDITGHAGYQDTIKLIFQTIELRSP